MKLPAASAGTVRLFEELLPDDPRVSVRKLFGQPAAFVGGNLFFGVFGSTLFVRLSERDRSRAERELRMVPFAPMDGHVMREYRVLPDSLLEEPREASEWIGIALEWAAKLPPKSVKGPGRSGTTARAKKPAKRSGR